MADSFLKEFETFDFRGEVNKRARVGAANPVPKHRATELELEDEVALAQQLEHENDDEVALAQQLADEAALHDMALQLADEAALAQQLENEGQQTEAERELEDEAALAQQLENEGEQTEDERAWYNTEAERTWYQPAAQGTQQQDHELQWGHDLAADIRRSLVINALGEHYGVPVGPAPLPPWREQKQQQGSTSAAAAAEHAARLAVPDAPGAPPAAAAAPAPVVLERKPKAAARQPAQQQQQQEQHQQQQQQQGAATTAATEAAVAEAKARALALYRAAQESIVFAAASRDDTEREAYEATEHALAGEFAIPWQDRGPRGPDAPATWKNQRWREGTQRYGNRGGDPVKNAYYAERARAKAAGKGNHNAGKHGKWKGSSSSSKPG
jgi:hypothetical protein